MLSFFNTQCSILSKSARLQKLVSMANEGTQEDIYIDDIPGGPAAFELCAKYCYSMTVTLNAHNVVAARCAAEYLEMYESIEKGNLIYKIDVFLNSIIFRSWKDSIIVLHKTESLLPWSEEVKVVSHCLEAIASKASTDTSKVDWSYTYNRERLVSENGGEQVYKDVSIKLSVPKDWWVEDLSDLDIDLYIRVITAIKSKGRVSSDVIGEALNIYALQKLPGFSKGMVQGGDFSNNQTLLEAIVRLLPRDKGCVSLSFLFRLFKASITLGCGEVVRTELHRRIGSKLDEALVSDLLIRAPTGEDTIYDIDLVENLVKEFIMQDNRDALGNSNSEIDSRELNKPVILSDASKGMVAKLVDCYLAEVSKDPNLPLSKFISLSELVSGLPRPSHDAIYRAIDMFLKVRSADC